MRSSRLLSILILLQLRGRVTADALAREFEVSVRTIYRDMDALSAAGVPLYGDKGPGGGFQLIDGYRTRLTGLDHAEVDALLLAGLPGPAQALGMGEAAGRARNKLLASLPAGSARKAGHISERLYIDHASWYRVAEPPTALSPLAAAVFAERSVSFTYESWTQTRIWIVDPLGLVIKDGDWYLVAQAGSKRLTFKVAQMAALKAREQCFARPVGFDLAIWWPESLARFETELRPLTARLRASPLGLKRIAALGSFAAQAVAGAEPADAQGWHPMKLPVETGDHSALALLGCGPEVEILEPPALRDKVRALAMEIVGRAGAGQPP